MNTTSYFSRVMAVVLVGCGFLLCGCAPSKKVLNPYDCLGERIELAFVPSSIVLSYAYLYEPIGRSLPIPEVDSLPKMVKDCNCWIVENDTLKYSSSDYCVFGRVGLEGLD